MRPLAQQARRACYYAMNAAQRLVPDVFFRQALAKRLTEVPAARAAEVADRVAYYLRHEQPFPLPDQAQRMRDIRSDGYTTYWFDLIRLLRYFPPHMRVAYLFGDIREVPPVPTVVKSRPIAEDNHHSVLLKLNQLRHYYFAADSLSFTQKRDVVVWRGKCHGRSHRMAIVERYHATPGCDIGDMNPKAEGQPTWKPYMTIEEQLRCKFVLSIEGNDVATNTKWIMASNSLCVMAKPRFETWFMEGRLIPDHHYVQVRDDYADLLEKRDHYLARPNEAEAIITNAQRHVARFLDQRVEEAIGLQVLRRYFMLSGQWSDSLP